MVEGLIERFYVDVKGLALNSPAATFCEEEAAMLQRIYLSLADKYKLALQTDILSGQISRFVEDAMNPDPPNSIPAAYIDAYIMVGQLLALSRSVPEYHKDCLEQLNQDLHEASLHGIELVELDATPFAVVCFFMCFEHCYGALTGEVKGELFNLLSLVNDRFGHSTRVIRTVQTRVAEEYDFGIDYANLLFASSIVLTCLNKPAEE